MMGMSKIGEAFHELYAGKTICEISYPELYAALMEDEGIEALKEKTAGMGCYVATSENGKVIFFAWEDGSTWVKAAIRNDGRRVLEEHEKVHAFTDFMLSVSDLDGTITMGHQMRAATIVSEVANSAALAEELASLSRILGVKQVSDNAKVTAVLEKMEGLGYLKKLNREREEYAVTGRIHLSEEIDAYFAAHIGSVAEELAKVDQGELF
jgi:hypothetical protein